MTLDEYELNQVVLAKGGGESGCSVQFNESAPLDLGVYGLSVAGCSGYVYPFVAFESDRVRLGASGRGYNGPMDGSAYASVYLNQLSLVQLGVSKCSSTEVATCSFGGLYVEYWHLEFSTEPSLGLFSRGSRYTSGSGDAYDDPFCSWSGGYVDITPVTVIHVPWVKYDSWMGEDRVLVETISQAVALADDGMTIRVAPGTYNEQIDFQGKAITIESTDGAAVTIIDGSGFTDGSVVTCMNGEGPDSVLRGFTIANGTAGTQLEKGDPTAGGGIFVNEASPTIEACIVRNNAADFGGGLFVRRGDVIVRTCHFIQNVGTFDGGGAQLNRSDGRLEECTFEQNVSGRNGGGVQVFTGSPFLIGCSFELNTALDNGGGIAWFPFMDDLLVEDCVLTRNSSSKGQGGGITVVTDQNSTGVLDLAASLLCNNTPFNIEGSFTDLGGNIVCGCPGDLNGDGAVTGADLSQLLAAWGSCADEPPCIADIDGNGQVDGADLAALLAAWGVCS